mmetsp:Transcript_21086/g.67201  ORF Transcript_21086/g.67201 Transcript_21086/m.67201 type:complete len:347 (-) Transcript_21086:1155-2195(-)
MRWWRSTAAARGSLAPRPAARPRASGASRARCACATSTSPTAGCMAPSAARSPWPAEAASGSSIARCLAARLQDTTGSSGGLRAAAAAAAAKAPSAAPFSAAAATSSSWTAPSSTTPRTAGREASRTRTTAAFPALEVREEAQAAVPAARLAAADSLPRNRPGLSLALEQHPTAPMPRSLPGAALKEPPGRAPIAATVAAAAWTRASIWPAALVLSREMRLPRPSSRSASWRSSPGRLAVEAAARAPAGARMAGVGPGAAEEAALAAERAEGTTTLASLAGPDSAAEMAGTPEHLPGPRAVVVPLLVAQSAASEAALFASSDAFCSATPASAAAVGATLGVGPLAA